MTAQQNPRVTQADREAAAKWCASQPFPSKQEEAPMIAAGDYDHHSLVQAFARHREAAEAASKAREAALVEALKRIQLIVTDYGKGTDCPDCHDAAMVCKVALTKEPDA